MGTKPIIVCYTLLIENSPQALPLGAACVASAIKNHPKTKDKFDVRLVADSMEELGDLKSASGICGRGDLQSEQAISGGECDLLSDKAIWGESPFAVCFSVFVWNRKQIVSMAREVKNRYPDCVTICGGPEVTANPESFIDDFDYVVPGSGEVSVPELLGRLWDTGESEELQSEMAVSGEKCGVQNFLGKILPIIQPSQELPSPYLDGTLDPVEYGGVLWELARGCPFKCSYCFESKGANKIQYFPIERIEAELDLFARKKIPQVFVLDPTYNADKKRAIQILNLIQKKTPNTFYYFEARAEFIDRELAKAFTKIPCALQIGLQSADENVLKLVHRSFNKKQFVKNINILNEEGVVFGFDLIYGLPGDTYNGFKQSVDFAFSLYPNNLETFCLSVLPGTVLYDEAEKLNLTFQNEPPYHVIHTDKYSENDLSKSEDLSNAINIFYNDGRAVPWFNSVCHFFHEKPSVFLINFIKLYEKLYNKSIKDAFHSEFCDFCNTNDMVSKSSEKSDFYKKSKNLSSCDLDLSNESSGFFKIQALQLEFLKSKCEEKHQEKAYKAIESIVKLHGAFSENENSGKSQAITLVYHPDDLLSEYATDIAFFVKNARPHKCKVIVQNGNYKIIK